MRPIASHYLSLFVIVAVSLTMPAIAQQSSTADAVVPNIINYSGTLVDLNGKPLTGIQGVTFLLYAAEQGGAPLWMESQNITPGENGQYTVNLGSTTAHGLPADLFSNGQAKWLAVQVAGQNEQARILLVAVPYALKAADAQTIGGLPPSAFVLANTSSAGQGHATSPGSATTPAANKSSAFPPNAAVTGLGSAGFISVWDTSSDIVDSIMFQRAGQIGVGMTAPTAMLDVNGRSNIRDTLTLVPKATDNTLAVNGTAFRISNAGTVTFVGGQTFPGTAQLAANNTFTGKQTINNVEVVNAGNSAGALQVTNTLTSGIAPAIVGTAKSPSANGISGVVSATTGTTAGVFGQTLSVGGYGVVGIGGVGVSGTSAVCNSGPNAGCPGGYFAGFNAATLDNQPGGDGVDVFGGSGGPDFQGGMGIVAMGGSSPDFGGSPGGFGVLAFGGTGSDTNGDGVGGSFTGGNLTLYGDGIQAFAGSGEAGTFIGSIFVTGSITAGVKDFKIDHPLEPANKYLVHASIESSEMMNLYAGNVTTDASGYAVVQLPKWFQAINTDLRYQLTVIGQFAQAIIAKKIENNAFTIRTNVPNVEVSWEVIGTRQDAFAKAHPLVVEEEKTGRLKGYYLHPELYGAPAEKQIEWARHPQTMKRVQQQQAAQRLSRAAGSSASPPDVAANH